MADQKITGTGWSGKVGPSGKVIGRTVDSSPAGLRKWARAGKQNPNACPKCDGAGKVDGGARKCGQCDGSGKKPGS